MEIKLLLIAWADNVFIDAGSNIVYNTHLDGVTSKQAHYGREDAVSTLRPRMQTRTEYRES